jgi:predicted ATP-dependent serine protease
MPENKNNQESVITAYPSYIAAQDQTGSTGLDSHLDPPACWTQIEHWTNDGKPYLKEYEGRGLLEGKAALITGGDSGIGRATAILMAREGADITICYLPSEQEDADWTIKHIEKAGRKAHGFVADLRDLDNTKKAVDEHMRVHGRLNILIPNGTVAQHSKSYT